MMNSIVPKYQKPITCQGCPLHEKAVGFCPDTVAPGADFVFIGEAPGKNEVAQGSPFIGQAGFVLRNWLIRAVPNIRLADEQGKITFMNTLRCLPPEIQGRAYPRGEEKRLAEAHCRQYDKLGNAHTVVLFGESPQRAWFGNELEVEDASDKRLGHDLKGVMGRIGRVYTRDNRRFVFAPHPAWILRQPALVEHGQRALQIAAGTERMVDVVYKPWKEALDEMRSL